MTDRVTTPMSGPCEKSQHTPSYGSALLRAVWIISGITVLIVILFLSVGRTRLSEVGREFFGAFVYSALIALPPSFS